MEQLITFETAKLASEKGYSPILLGDSFKDKLPTQSLLQQWLFKKHNLWVAVFQDQDKFDFDITSTKDKTLHFELEDIYPYNLPNEALEKGLQEALKLI